MQTSPCWIWSGTDFFITSKGIIGTETTIGGFIAYENNYPIGYRIRQAMQYGNNLDDYINILLDGNSGDGFLDGLRDLCGLALPRRSRQDQP
jgi:hypothetical protein